MYLCLSPFLSLSQGIFFYSNQVFINYVVLKVGLMDFDGYFLSAYRMFKKVAIVTSVVTALSKSE